MIDCDRCGEEVQYLLRHRDYGGTATHRTTQWLCQSCHPDFATDRAAASTDDTDDASKTVVTDGGRSSASCPQCAAAAVNVQGMLDCVDCSWHGR